MKNLLMVFLIGLMACAAQASTEKITIAQVNEIINTEFPYMVRNEKISDNATCEEVDAFLKNHGIQINDDDGNTQLAKDRIVCESAK